MANDWITTYYNQEEVFPMVLYAITVRLGILGRPKVYADECTQYCEVTVHIGATNKFLENYFKGFIVQYVERNKNTKANKLAKVVARNTPLLTDVFFQVIEDALVKTVEPEPKIINAIEGED
jgi:hypothetical protein